MQSAQEEAGSRVTACSYWFRPRGPARKEEKGERSMPRKLLVPELQKGRF